MNKITFTLIALLITTPSVYARGGGGHSGGHSHASSSYSPGTGSKSSSTHVKGYTKKDGTYVEGHSRSTPDKNFNNNWSTKGNENPHTGKDGSQVTPPEKN